MKICFKCGENKPLSEFYKHKAMGDGYLGKCKCCTKKDATAHRNENLEKVRAYDRERALLPHRKENLARVVEEYKAKYPERVKATNAVNNALRDGKIEKWPCMICGNEKTVGHHCDYSRPLDVVWLCQAHHKQIHKDYK